MLTLTCDCKRARHEHGDNVMYTIHKCRCDTCREAAVDRARVRRKNQMYGRYHLTDAEPARRHIRSLMAQGMGWKRIARAAGLSPSSVYPILWAQDTKSRKRPMRKQISKETEEKLLAVTVDMAEGAVVNSLGSVRRLQALAALGWSQHRLADLLGMFPGNFGKVIHGERAGIRVSTAKQIETLFNENWDKTPLAANRFEQAGITRAKREAAAKGWVTAAAWDDIDDPNEEPKADLVDESIDRRSLPAIEKLDRLELLTRDGYGDNDDTFVRAGWASRASAWKVLQRMDRLDLVERLQRNDNVRQVAS